MLDSAMQRRSFLGALLGLAVTPALATRLLPIRPANWGRVTVDMMDQIVMFIPVNVIRLPHGAMELLRAREIEYTKIRMSRGA